MIIRKLQNSRSQRALLTTVLFSVKHQPSLVSDVITPEADLGLNLVFYLNLQNGAASWAEKLLQLKGLRNTDRRQTAEMVRQKGYDVKENLASLLRLYEDKKR